MQNKKQVKKTAQIKLGFWHYLTIAATIALIVSSILKLITPRQEELSLNNQVFLENHNKTKSSFKKISYSGPDISLPENFSVFQARPSNVAAEILAGKILNDKSMQLHPEIANYWLGENTQLVKSNYENNYTFVEIINKGNEEVYVVEDMAIQTCLNFYKKYQSEILLNVQKKDIIYLNNSEEQSLTEKETAHVMQIPLTYELEGYPVYYEGEEDYPFFCKIDNNYNLSRVVFKNFFYNFESIFKMPPISVDMAISNIKKGVVSIIDAESQIVDNIDLNWINEAELYSVEIEYRYDDILKIVYPFYRFEGTLTNSAGINIQAALITPAVATAIEK